MCCHELQRRCLQIAEREQWEAEQQVLQQRAAEWCEQQIQLERNKAAIAIAAADATARDW